MRKIYLSSLFLTAILIALGTHRADAQIKIGTNGANISPASLLELESANQGLLIPRMANTTAIDALNPPNGMIVYITTEPSGLYIKKTAGWEYLTGFLGGNAFFNSVTVNGSVTATSFSGPLIGNASTATLATTATNSNNAAVTNDISNPGVTYPVFVNSTPGYQPLRTSSGNLSYVPATGILTARGFNGPLVGDVTGNATSSIDAQNTVNIRITDDLVTPTTMYLTFVGGTSGPLPARVSSSRLSFIPLTGELTAPIFRGNLLGNATSATTVTGVVNAPNGGTGQTIYTPGDILYADASNTLAKLPIGVPGTILRVDPSNRPTWSTAGAGTVTNVTGVANRISVVDPTVAPIVDIDVNYAGQASINTLGTITTGTWNGATIPTAHGGTGATSFIANEVLIGSGPGNPITSLSLVGTAGKVLRSNGPNALPTFETPGIGDMVLNVDQTVDGIKRFNSGTLILKGSGTGVTTLVPDANSNGIITLPSGTRRLVGETGTQTLFDKTLDAPNITGTGNFQTLTGGQLFLGGAGTPLTTTAQTGTGRIVMENTPTLISPNIGAATGTSLSVTGSVTATGGFVGNASSASSVGGRTAADIVTGVDRANNAVPTNNFGTIVRRDGNGDFWATTVNANLVGNVTGNISGNAATVSVNANLTGEVTSLGNATTVTNAAVISKTLTGFVSGTGALGAGDNILQAIQKLDGNIALKAPINNPVFTGGITTPAITLGGTPLTASGAELNFVTGVTSSIQTQLNGKQGTLTNSAGLAGALSDETGTGVAVFSASPTFTGTVTIPSPFNLGATSVTTTGAQLNLINGASGTTGTTTSNIVFSTSPTLTTPILGAAAVSSLTGNSAAVGEADGAGITLSTVSGTNLSGSIELTSNATGAGNAVLFTLTYAGLTYPTNSYPVLTPANPAAAALTTTDQVYVIGNQGNFQIMSGTNTLPVGTYKWNYMVSGN